MPDSTPTDPGPPELEYLLTPLHSSDWAQSVTAPVVLPWLVTDTHASSMESRSCGPAQANGRSRIMPSTRGGGGGGGGGAMAGQ